MSFCKIFSQYYKIDMILALWLMCEQIVHVTAFFTTIELCCCQLCLKRADIQYFEVFTISKFWMHARFTPIGIINGKVPEDPIPMMSTIEKAPGL